MAKRQRQRQRTYEAAMGKALAHFLGRGIPLEEITPEALREHMHDVLGITDKDALAMMGISQQEVIESFEHGVITWRVKVLGLPPLPPEREPGMAEAVAGWVEHFERERMDEDPERMAGIARVDEGIMAIYRDWGWIQE
jgi:hypothetical protein